MFLQTTDVDSFPNSITSYLIDHAPYSDHFEIVTESDGVGAVHLRGEELIFFEYFHVLFEDKAVSIKNNTCLDFSLSLFF